LYFKGDPLTLFLFLFFVVVEDLFGLLRQAVGRGDFSCVGVGKKDVKVSMLQFTHDTSIFAKSNLKTVICIKSILRWFEIMSGFKLNFHKSSLIGVQQVEEGLVKRFANLLNCRISTLPFEYLGIQVGANPRSQLGEPIIQKIKKRLSTWKQKQLFLGGRVCLINYVISTLFLFFFLSIFL